MATYWVSNANGADYDLGSDTYDGTSPTFEGGLVGPKLTLNGATGAWQLPLVAGDTINIINTGTPYVETVNRVFATASLIGTNYTSAWGLRVQGTDASGNPSLVTMRSGGNTILMSVRSNQTYFLVQGLYYDRVGGATVSNNLTFVSLNKNGAGQAGPVWMRNCCDNNSATKSGRLLFDQTGDATPNTDIEISHCATFDWGSNAGIALSSSTRRRVLIHNNVFVQRLTSSATWINLGADDTTAAVDHQVYNNTYVFHAGRAAACILSTSATAHANARKAVQNNLFVQLGATAGTDIFVTGNAAWAGAWTGSRIFSNNVFTGSGTIAWSAAVGPYQVPWDEDNSDAAGEPDFYATDTTGSTDPFYDSATPFNWNANSAGWLIPLPGDYRLSALRSAGTGGSVPGAIPDGINPPVAADNAYSTNNDVTLTQSAPGVLSGDTDADGDTLTAVLTGALTPATAGALVLNANGGFTYTPTAGFTGTATFKYKAFDSFFYSNEATVTLTVNDPPPVVLASSSLVGPNLPGRAYVDSGMLLTTNSILRLGREYRPDPIAFTAGYPATAVVPASTTDAALALGSLTAITCLMIETDQPISIKLNNAAAIPLLKGGCLFLANANTITSVKVTNASTFRAANLTLVAVS